MSGQNKNAGDSPGAKDWLFPELDGGTSKQRGRDSRLSKEYARMGKTLADFIPWYWKENPNWPENVIHEITGAAVECLRDFLAKQTAPIPSPFSVEFRFPVKVAPDFLTINPPPIGIDPAEWEAFQNATANMEDMVSRLLEEKAAEAASKGEPAPAITPEQREEAKRRGIKAAEKVLFKREANRNKAKIHTLRHGEFITDEDISRLEKEWRAANPGQELPEMTPAQVAKFQKMEEEQCNPDLWHWFNEWRWAIFLREGWTDYKDACDGTAPEPSTLTLWHFPAPEREKNQPLWGSGQTIALRLETLQASVAKDPKGFLIPATNSPEAIEGKGLFEKLCPDGTLDRVQGCNLTISDPETRIDFRIRIELHPLTFDFRKAEEVETYFPFVIFCERGEGGKAWEEIPEPDREEIFSKLLAELEAKSTPENWNFPGWDAEKKNGKRKHGFPKAVARERIRPPKPALEIPTVFERRSAQIARNITGRAQLENPLQSLLPFVDTNSGKEIALSGGGKGEDFSIVGFDFSALELRVIDGMERLFEKYGMPEDLQFLTDIETFAEACGAQKGARDGSRFSPYEISDLWAAVVSISNKKGLMVYSDDRGNAIRTAGYLWQPIQAFSELKKEEVEALRKQKQITEEVVSKLHWVGVRFDPIWRRAPIGTKGKALFYHKPANLRERLEIAGYRKRSRFTENFLTWIYSAGEPIMHYYRDGKRADAIIEIPLQKLAEICRMEHFLARGFPSRVKKQIEEAAGYAKAIGIITNNAKTAFDKKRLTYRFELRDGGHWKELHTWLDEQEAAREPDTKKKQPPAAPAECQAELEKVFIGRMQEFDRRHSDYQKTEWASGLKNCKDLIADFEKDLSKAKKETGTDPGAKLAKIEMLKKLIAEARGKLAGGKMPESQKQPTKPAPENKPIPEPEAAEITPATDPAAAAIWEPIRAEIFKTIPEKMREKTSQAIPCELAELEGMQRLVLWFPLPGPAWILANCKKEFATCAAAAGVSLAWKTTSTPDPQTVI